jgi:hypothetical protein
VRRGNLLVADLRADGVYRVFVEVADVSVSSSPRTIDACVRCRSGTLFIGPGEVITGDRLQPDQDCGGLFLNVEPGVFRVGMAKHGTEVRIRLEATQKDVNSDESLNKTSWDALRFDKGE